MTLVVGSGPARDKCHRPVCQGVLCRLKAARWTGTPLHVGGQVRAMRPNRQGVSAPQSLKARRTVLTVPSTAARRLAALRLKSLPHPEAPMYAVLFAPEKHVVAAHLSIRQRCGVRIIAPACSTGNVAQCAGLRHHTSASRHAEFVTCTQRPRSLPCAHQPSPPGAEARITDSQVGEGERRTAHSRPVR